MLGASGAKQRTAVLATLVIGLTACGDNDGDDTTAREPANGSCAVERRGRSIGSLCGKNEEPGFRPGALPGATPRSRETVTGVNAFVDGDAACAPADARRLRSEGFISFTVQPIRGPRRRPG